MSVSQNARPHVTQRVVPTAAFGRLQCLASCSSRFAVGEPKAAGLARGGLGPEARPWPRRTKDLGVPSAYGFPSLASL